MKNRPTRLVAFGLLLGLLWSALPLRGASAWFCTDTYTVVNTADSGSGSLREAFSASSGSVCPGGEVIFDPSLDGLIITFSSGEIAVAQTGGFDDKHQTVIDGNAVPNLILSGGSANRLFSIASNTEFTLRNLTLANGLANAGGAVYNAGNLTVQTVTFQNNVSNGTSYPNDAGGAIFNEFGATLNITEGDFRFNSHTGNGHGGGAIYSYGNTTIRKSAFQSNTSNGNGGGAIAQGVDGASPSLNIDETSFEANTATGDYGSGGAIDSSGNFYITKSFFRANTAAVRGGAMSIINVDESAHLANVTFSANRANEDGGAIYYRDNLLSLNNVTIANNIADADSNGIGDGGGIFNEGWAAAPILDNSILSGNTDPIGGPDCFGEISSSRGHNLIQNITGCTLSGVTTGNLTGVSPNLAALADNGGDTQTHALQEGSPAINAAENVSCEGTDQRNVARPQLGVCDMGAYEYESILTVEETSLQPTYTTGPSAFTVTFSEAAQNPAGDDGADDVTNPANYLLLEEGSATGFSTTSCAALSTEDALQTVSSVTYNAATFVSQVSLPSALPAGNYRLHVCGTTSIVNAGGIPLNNGRDYTFDFTVQAAAEVVTLTSSGTSLPATGFARGRESALPARSPANTYAKYSDLWLQIPSLGVESAIVGVSQTSSGWDVSWLGQSTGWLQGSAFPTWQGNTVLTGHVWDADNTPGIFAQIKKLKYGERFSIHAYGQEYIYEVRENRWLWSGSAVQKVFQHEEEDWVTLLTCEGYNPLSGNYFFRRMVRAVLVQIR